MWQFQTIFTAVLAGAGSISARSPIISAHRDGDVQVVSLAPVGEPVFSIHLHTRALIKKQKSARILARHDTPGATSASSPHQVYKAHTLAARASGSGGASNSGKPSGSGKKGPSRYKEKQYLEGGRTPWLPSSGQQHVPQGAPAYIPRGRRRSDSAKVSGPSESKRGSWYKDQNYLNEGRRPWMTGQDGTTSSSGGSQSVEKVQASISNKRPWLSFSGGQDASGGPSKQQTTRAPSNVALRPQTIRVPSSVEPRPQTSRSPSPGNVHGSPRHSPSPRLSEFHFSPEKFDGWWDEALDP